MNGACLFLGILFLAAGITSIPVRRLIILQHGRQCRRKKKEKSTFVPFAEMWG